MGIIETTAAVIIITCSIIIIADCVRILKDISDELWGAKPN